EQGDGFAVGWLDHEPAQSDRQLRIGLAGEAHLTVPEHGETITAGERDRALADDVEAHVGLGSGDEERARLSDRGPPAVMAIALVKDIGAPASIAIVRPIWASLRLASVMSRMLGQSAFGSKTTCIFRPRMHPFDLAQSHSLPRGMGIASISLTIVAPSRRLRRSS